jgi:single-stranded DNA-specific DHH superfamily exonuclease
MCNPANIRQHLKQLDDGINGVFYGMDFGEPEEMMRAFQVEEITNIGVDDHVIYALSNEMTNLSEEQFNDYIKYHLSVCAQPSIIGHSCHGLWIGRKKHD